MEDDRKEYIRGYVDGRNSILVKLLKYDKLELEQIVPIIKFLQNK